MEISLQRKLISSQDLLFQKAAPISLHWLHEDFLQGILSFSARPHRTQQHNTWGSCKLRFFSPITPQSLFGASWSPASFDVRQAWTRADLQLTNDAELPQKHPCGATSSWQSNTPSAVPPAPPQKPCVWQEGLTPNTRAFYPHSLFKGAVLGQLFACKPALKPPSPETK